MDQNICLVLYPLYLTQFYICQIFVSVATKKEIEWFTDLDDTSYWKHNFFLNIEFEIF